MSTSRTDREPPRAVALRHGGALGVAGGSVPEVIAKGRGELAERILAAAAAAGVPIRADRDLLALLAVCDLGDEVPPEMYRVVAELVHWAWQQNGRLAASGAVLDAAEPSR